MARIETDPNYTTPTFSRATAGADIFKKEDVQTVAAALSTHNHDGAGKGLSVSAPGSIPGVALVVGSVTSSQIADGTIATIDLADHSVTSVKLGDSLTLTGTTTVAQFVVTGSEQVNGNLTVTGFTTIGGTLTVGAIGGVTSLAFAASANMTATADKINVNNSLGTTYDLSVGRNATVGGTLGVTGALTSGAHTVNGTLDASSWVRSQSNTFYLATAGQGILGDGTNIRYRAASGGYHSFENTGGALEGTLMGWMSTTGTRQDTYRITLQNTAPTDHSGKAIATGWDSWSAKSFKTNVVPIDDALAIVTNDTLHGHYYNHVDDPNGVRDVGFIADDWLGVVPGVVSADANGNAIGMDYASVGAITFEALKQLEARVAALEAA